MNDEHAVSETWSESDSGVYRGLAPAAVPARAEQLAVVATLLPFEPQEDFTFVEAGSGEGLLSATILELYPNARGVALDGSESMRAATAQRLEPYGDRFEVHPFDLLSSDWLGRVDGAGAVVSSLVIHHLDGDGKRKLFRQLGSRLSERGVVLIADLVAATGAPHNELLAATWDSETRAASLAEHGDDRLYDEFVRTRWNIYRHPDPVDRPSPLFEQLTWLRDSGFVIVDCFWLRAGHAVYGGYKSLPSRASAGFERALAAAHKALS